MLDRTLNGRVTRQSLEWVPALDLSITLRLDAFAAVMALIITIVGLAVLGYSCSYFDPDDPGLGRLAGLLTLFGGAMLGIVLADDLITLFTAWEITSVVSYLLIGNEHTRTQARAAALHALLVTSTGGLAMLAGIVLIGQAAGTYRISELLRDPPTGTTVTTGLVLVAVGAFTKSAQYPFHSWLPGAMAAPTPVSAYLHSATMVKAGVYLLARFAPVFALHAPWRPLVVTVGLVTMIAGGLRALRQYDLKLLLAHGTVSQLGFLVVLFGVGIPGATAAGILAIVAHAAFKAALFLTVGVIDHQTGTRDIRLVPPLGDGWRVVKVTVVVAAASMAGVPLLAGFLAKEAAYDAFVGGPFAGSVVVATAVVAGSALTVAYSGTFRVGNPAPAGAPALGQRGRHHPGPRRRARRRRRGARRSAATTALHRGRGAARRIRRRGRRGPGGARSAGPGRDHRPRPRGPSGPCGAVARLRRAAVPDGGDVRARRHPVRAAAPGVALAAARGAGADAEPTSTSGSSMA